MGENAHTHRSRQSTTHARPGPGAAPPIRKRLVLASGSPRRRELLAALVPSADQVVPGDSETPPRRGESPEEFVTRLSLAKANAVAQHASEAIVIGADTAVVIDNQVLGKPTGPEDAAGMLRRLRGRTHRVVTGVTVLDGGDGHTACKSTEVRMRSYSDKEIAAYVASGEPFDKAGGYAVQDESFRPAESVNGCYLSVVGLPLCEVVTLLAEIGAPTEITPGWRPPAECQDCPLRSPVETDQPGSHRGRELEAGGGYRP